MQQRARRGKHMTQQQRENEAPSGTAGRPMRVERDVKVTMRDGVRVSLCVYRPQAEGPVPALFAASPYQHEFDSVPAFPLFLWRETGPIEWYVAQGYAYVHADVRGSGRSEGEFGFMDATEQEDFVELIDWIARQAWCSGRSYGAWTMAWPPESSAAQTEDQRTDGWINWSGSPRCLRASHDAENSLNRPASMPYCWRRNGEPE